MYLYDDPPLVVRLFLVSYPLLSPLHHCLLSSLHFAGTNEDYFFQPLYFPDNICCTAPQIPATTQLRKRQTGEGGGMEKKERTWANIRASSKPASSLQPETCCEVAVQLQKVHNSCDSSTA